MTTSGVRLCLAAFAIFTASALHVRSPGLSLLWLVFVIAGAVLAVTTVLAEPTSTPGALGVTSALVFLGVVINALLLESQPTSLLVTILCVVGAVGLTLWTVNQRRPVHFVLDPAVYFVALYAILVGAWLLSHPHHIDVVSVQEDAVGGLLSGQNPLSVPYRNIYTPDETLRFWGPAMVGAETLPGFPYPPLTFLTATIGFVGGDVRFAGLILSSILCLFLVRAKDDRRRILGILLLAAPGSVWVFTGGWTEAFILPLLGRLRWRSGARSSSSRPSAWDCSSSPSSTSSAWSHAYGFSGRIGRQCEDSLACAQPQLPRCHG